MDYKHIELVKETANVLGDLSSAVGDNRSAPNIQCFTSAFSADEKKFAWCSGEKHVLIIDWDKYKETLTRNSCYEENYNLLELQPIDCGYPVRSLAFGAGTPDNEIYSANKDHFTRFDHKKDLVLATGHKNGRIRIWDTNTGKLLLDLFDQNESIHCLGFAPDGSLRLVSGSKDSSLKVWDVTDDGNMFKKLFGHGFPVCCVSWSSNSKLLCSVGDQKKAFIWNMEDYTLKLKLIGHYHDIQSCSFSPDGAMVATASKDTRVIVWDTNTGEQLRVLEHASPPPGMIYMSGSNQSAVNGISFSPNGIFVASVCADGLLRYWNLMSEDKDLLPECIGLSMMGDIMTSCSFSPGGGILAVNHESGGILFYSTPSKVPPLLHLSRMSVRKGLGNVTQDSTLSIPQILKPYLQYKHW